MADLSLLGFHGDPEEDFDEFTDPAADGPHRTSSNTSVNQLIIAAESSDFSNREIASAELLNVIHSCETLETATEVIPVISRLLADNEPLMRSRVVDQMVDISTAFARFGPEGVACVKSDLLPAAIQLLVDPYEPVRTSCRALLLLALQKQLLPQPDLEAIIAPMFELLALNEKSDELRSEFLTIVHETAGQMGKSFCTQYYLPKVLLLASDPGFRVRKSCAGCIVSLGITLGEDVVLNTLVPIFDELSKDEIWGVRKACAEQIAQLSEIVPATFRLSTITPWFARLADDSSRWVRSSAYRSLGPLIATYAPPVPVDGILFIEEDELRYEDELDDSFSCSTGTTSRAASMADLMPPPPAIIDIPKPNLPPIATLSIGSIQEESSRSSSMLSSLASSDDSLDSIFGKSESRLAKLLEGFSLGDDSSTEASEPSEPLFAASPLKSQPTLFLGTSTAEESASDHALFSQLRDDSGMVTNKESDNDRILRGSDGDLSGTTAPAPPITDDSLLDTMRQHSFSKDRVGTSPHQRPMSSTFSRQSSNGFRRIHAPKTLAVPEDLISYYKFMIDESSTKVIDSEITRMCAFSLPAVTWALGRRHWHKIRDILTALTGSDDWKVRSTLSHSIHVLAQIVGRRLAEEDLVVKFNTFIRDWDEVRLGALKHFAEFLCVLSPQTRKVYLPVLTSLREGDDSKNWRFRRILARQLMELSCLYSADDVDAFIVPIALNLAGDPIAFVRQPAFETLGVILKLFVENDAVRHAESLVFQLSLMAQSTKSYERQGYIRIAFFVAHFLPASFFASQFLLQILTLQNDVVSNVRLALARLLSQTAHPGYFEAHVTESSLVQGALATLRLDADPDVAYYASLAPGVLDDPNGDRVQTGNIAPT